MRVGLPTEAEIVEETPGFAPAALAQGVGRRIWMRGVSWVMVIGSAPPPASGADDGAGLPKEIDVCVFPRFCRALSAFSQLVVKA